jgi:putative thioredoxin
VAIDVNQANFDAVVIKGSATVPVLVDFWAPWCAPCRSLTPILEKLVAEYEGKFVLAKVNSDDNPELSARYGVRGIPNVKAFIDGEVVDEFAGAMPEGAVRQFLERIVPSPAEELRFEAARVYDETRDIDRALALLSRAAELDPTNEEIRIDRASLLIDAHRAHEASAVLDGLSPLTKMDERVKALEARMELARGAAEAGSADLLVQRVAADENDLDARLKLAHVYVASENYRAALEQLLEIVQRNRSFREDIARKTILQVFEVLGNQGSLVSEFRRRLASAMN